MGRSSRVLVDLSELHMQRVPVVAPVALAGGKQRSRLFPTFRVNAPLLSPGNNHRGVKCLDLLFACLGRHVDFAFQESLQLTTHQRISCEQTGNRAEGSGTGNGSAC